MGTLVYPISDGFENFKKLKNINFKSVSKCGPHIVYTLNAEGTDATQPSLNHALLERFFVPLEQDKIKNVPKSLVSKLSPFRLTNPLSDPEAREAREAEAERVARVAEAEREAERVAREAERVARVAAENAETELNEANAALQARFNNEAEEQKQKEAEEQKKALEAEIARNETEQLQKQADEQKRKKAEERTKKEAEQLRIDQQEQADRFKKAELEQKHMELLNSVQANDTKLVNVKNEIDATIAALETTLRDEIKDAINDASTVTDGKIKASETKTTKQITDLHAGLTNISTLQQVAFDAKLGVSEARIDGIEARINRNIQNTVGALDAKLTNTMAGLVGGGTGAAGPGPAPVVPPAAAVGGTGSAIGGAARTALIGIDDEKPDIVAIIQNAITNSRAAGTVLKNNLTIRRENWLVNRVTNKRGPHAPALTRFEQTKHEVKKTLRFVPDSCFSNAVDIFQLMTRRIKTPSTSLHADGTLESYIDCGNLPRTLVLIVDRNQKFPIPILKPNMYGFICGQRRRLSVVVLKDPKLGNVSYICPSSSKGTHIEISWKIYSGAGAGIIYEDWSGFKFESFMFIFSL